MPKSHGFSGSRTYRSWQEMKQRCDNPKRKDYPKYGGRGIRVAARWYQFEAFLADMGERPPGHTLDRINANGHYEPGNVRWATVQEQANNLSRTVKYRFEGAELTVMEISRRLGMKFHTLRKRLKGLQWTAEDAFSTPTRSWRHAG